MSTIFSLVFGAAIGVGAAVLRNQGIMEDELFFTLYGVLGGIIWVSVTAFLIKRGL